MNLRHSPIPATDSDTRDRDRFGTGAGLKPDTEVSVAKNGSDAFAIFQKSQRWLARREFEAALRRHVIDAWFPRCLDLEHGGFLSDFNHAWRVCGPQEKLLEFQARQTWMAAELLEFAPNDERLRHAALHGFRFLRDVMWDHRSGGWFHRTNRGGEPLEAYTKHAHGIAYGINACLTVHTATAEAGALDLAQEAFAWLERYAHDEEYGGYFGWLKREGTPIRQASHCPWKTECDTLGTPIGFKDINVNSDVLETLLYVNRRLPNAKVTDRLRELVRLFCRKIITPTGGMFFFFEPDWTPPPQLMRYGQALQTTHRLLLLRHIIRTEESLISVARSLIDLTLRYAWDNENGGIFFAGPGTSSTSLDGYDLVVRTKPWWVQFEALRALLEMSFAVTNRERYLDYFKRQWRYVQKRIFDMQRRGTYPYGLDNAPRWQMLFGRRFAPSEVTRKAHEWKDGSHEAWSLLYCISALGSDASELAGPK
jgi:mannobiose 2-epimerase